MANLLKPRISRGPRPTTIAPSMGKANIRDLRGENAKPNIPTITADVVTPDLREVNRSGFYVAPTANLTLAWPLGAYVGAEMTFIFAQDGTGGRTLTLGAGWRQGDSYTAPDTAANATSLFKGYIQQADDVNNLAYLNRIGSFAPTLVYRTGAKSTLETITIPATVADGDVGVLLDFVKNTSGTPSVVTPTGWTSAKTSSTGEYAAAMSYKLMLASEAGASVTGMVGVSSTSKIMLIFAGSSASIALGAGASIEITTGNPTSQTVDAGSASSSNVIVIAMTAETAAAPVLTVQTPSMDATDTSQFVRAYYRVYAGVPASHTVDLGDSGAYDVLGSFYLELT